MSLFDGGRKILGIERTFTVQPRVLIGIGVFIVIVGGIVFLALFK